MVTKESIQQTLGLLCICFAAACGSSSGDSVPLGGEAVGGAEEGGSGNQGGHGGEAEPPPPVDGDPCGECGAGEWRDAACHMPSMDVDLVRGLPPAPTDHRDVFNPDDFEGSDTLKLERASQAAAAVGGAVVMHRVFETIETVYAYEGVMYTGGGIRRACTPVATVVRPSLPSDSCVRVDTTEGFSRGTLLAGVVGPAANDYKGLMALATGSADELCAYSALGFSLPAGAKIVQTSTLLAAPDYPADIVVDSVLFDGNNRCNFYTHDSRLNTALSLRGSNTIRNSVFYDSPSEGITSCGATIDGNRAFQLQGSLVHKSCGMAPEPLDTIVNNYVDGSNLAGNQVMQHSAGLITLSANAGTIELNGNVFRNGGEGVYGYASPDTEQIFAHDDCYAHFDRVITLYGGANEEAFSFDVELIDVPVVFAPFTGWPQ